MSHLNVIFAYSVGSLEALTTSNVTVVFSCVSAETVYSQTPKASELNKVCASSKAKEAKEICLYQGSIFEIISPRMRAFIYNYAFIYYLLRLVIDENILMWKLMIRSAYMLLD